MTVSGFLAVINQTLDFAYPQVVIEGEVASFKINQGKWVFFDLKDSESTVGCFLSVYQLKVALEDGMLIRVTARPNITKWGKFSLTVTAIELAGEGAVRKAFELLKARFEAEGLFAPERKRPLPDFPRRITLITSAQAAAYNDFLKIIEGRWPYLTINHIQVQVQGVSAPEQIVAALNTANVSPAKPDIIVMIRGGGSAEDLQAFNHEDVVRAVFGSRVPTLVAIGHEDDVTLAELVADVRGATPTDAARLVVPDRADIAGQIQHQQARISTAISHQIAAQTSKINHLYSAFASQLRDVEQLTGGLRARLSLSAEQLTRQAWQRLENCQHLLASLNPTAILARGYSIATVRGRVIKDAAQVQPSDLIMLQLSHGSLNLQQKVDQDDDIRQKLF